jgi:hypothetical protein
MKGTSEMPKVSRESAANVENHGPVEDRNEDLDDYTVNFLTFARTIDATPLFKGLPDDRCSCPHWAYIFKGKITFRFADHDEVFEAGDAFYVPRATTRSLKQEPSTSSSARATNCTRSPTSWPRMLKR